MSPTTRSVKKHTKVRQRRRLTAQERLARDRRQAQDHTLKGLIAVHCAFLAIAPPPAVAGPCAHVGVLGV
jgi:hypothetical protein